MVQYEFVYANIVADGGAREFGAVDFTGVWVGGYRGSGTVGGAEDVGTEDEEAIGVEGFPSTYQWPPPSFVFGRFHAMHVYDSWTYQSSTSALPVNAWHIIMTLSLVSFSFPHVL